MSSYMIFDDVFEFAFRQDLYTFFSKSAFFLGWSDRTDPAPSSHRYLHSKYSDLDIENCGFFDNIINDDLNQILEDKRLTQAVVNLSHPVNTYYVHSHKGLYSLIYYANIEWQPNWHGETLVYEQNGKDIQACVPFIPNRVLLLDKGIPHALRPPSVMCPDYRFTFACFFEDKE